MRDYQPAKNNPFWLEPTVYRCALAIVRDYPRLLNARQDILHGSPARSDSQGAPKGVPSDPTAQRALRLERVEERIRQIEGAIGTLPKKYRAAVLSNIVDERNGVSRDFAARKVGCSPTTIKYYRAKLLFEIAERMI